MVNAKRILIVEDDERIGATLLRALIGSGYEARWERTGEQAVSAGSAQKAQAGTSAMVGSLSVTDAELGELIDTRAAPMQYM